MLSISEHDIRRRVERDNPWWSPNPKPILESSYPRRVYFASFKKLSLDRKIKRATVLLGPRRVGKTFMVKQLVHEAIVDGNNPRCIMYVSIDTPVYSGISLEKFLSLMPESDDERKIVIFDEIQYLKNWESHLKDLIDNYPNFKFVVTGSAAAALRLKSQESGAGRFSDFMLPPLTFHEFLLFSDCHDDVIREEKDAYDRTIYLSNNIEELNKRFVDYLNYGGYPEAVLNQTIRENAEQFIKNDIIDKVLLKDLPSLYGINEIPELNKLFSVLAYNTGNEVSLENISRDSGITKPTIKKYIEYLESAFLIIKLTTVDDNCRTMKRERNFKVYLNNPSMRAALFAPVEYDDSARIGHLAESAIISQWQHSSNFSSLRYARWRNDGEVDIVSLGSDQRPHWVGEIKWSDAVKNKFSSETKSIRTMIERHSTIGSAFFTTKTYSHDSSFGRVNLNMFPSALYCYTVGRNITKNMTIKPAATAR